MRSQRGVPLGGLVGSQVPTYQVAPPRVGSAVAEVVDLAEACGLTLDPWQRHVLEVGLGERADGRWAASTVGLIVPRQNGKGVVLEALELAHLFLFGSKLVIHTAHQMRPMCMEHFRRMLDLIDSNSEVRKLIKKVGRANGDEGIELRSGARIKFVARSDTTARGMSGDLVVLDEALTVTTEQVAALMPTMSARPNPQVWFTSSAPLVNSIVLHDLRKWAVDGRGNGRTAIMVWEASRPDCDLTDREEWARANPGLGYRISEEAVERELGVMSPGTFRRERLGIPDLAPMVVDARSGMPVEAWRSCADPRSTTSQPVMFGLDVAVDRSRAAIVVVGPAADGRTHVELVEWSPELRRVGDRCAELTKKWGAPFCVVDGSPAMSLLPDLRKRGVQVQVIPRREWPAACGAIVDMVLAGEIVHIDQPIMEVAVMEVVRRSVGDGWVWDRRGKRDISPLVAVTAAVWASRRQSEPVVPVDAAVW